MSRPTRKAASHKQGPGYVFNSERGILISTDGKHAAYTTKIDGIHYLFNGNDCKTWYEPQNAPHVLPPDGFHLSQYKKYKRPLMSLNSSLQSKDNSGECFSCATYVKRCFEGPANRNIDAFFNMARETEGDWRRLPQPIVQSTKKRKRTI